jgi:putative hydrolase of the HAD superfamily
LYADYHTYLLSNTNLIHLRYITKYLIRTYGRADLDTLFDKVYYSFAIGCRKPEPESFLRVLNDNNLKAAETLYIDDSPQHIVAAKALGIQAVLFQNDSDLNPSWNSIL